MTGYQRRIPQRYNGINLKKKLDGLLVVSIRDSRGGVGVGGGGGSVVGVGIVGS